MIDAIGILMVDKKDSMPDVKIISFPEKKRLKQRIKETIQKAKEKKKE